LIHERLLWGLGVVTALALAARGALMPALTVLGATAAYALFCRFAPARLRLASAYVYTLWFYEAVAWITPALGRPTWDASLLAVDRALFGESPAIAMQAWHAPWLTDVMSLCYLGYHAYLHGALLWALRRREDAERLYVPLFTAFALGLAGYLLVPATGPAIAYTTAFAQPIAGGWATALSDAVISRGTSLYDVFPSLHVLITLVLLAHDRRHLRRRFWTMLPVCLGLFVSTLYLRYHYAVDVLAGAAFFALAAALSTRPAGEIRRADRAASG
jgi:membrane-associated phospholipid phosphatase